MSTVDWNHYREQFPALSKRAYFGWAAVAPLSTRVAARMRAQIEGVVQHGVTEYREWYKTYDSLREEARKLIGATNTGEIALLKNTSEGISTAALGLGLHAGENVLLPCGEFPANAYPWLALTAKGVEVRRVKTDEFGRYTCDDIARQVDAKTRAVAVSFVNFATGFRSDLATIGRFCRERGIFFFVDAIQGLGALPLDVGAMCIDALAADGHKWICGPEGMAIFFVRRAWISKIRPLSLGWWSVDNPSRYDLDDQPLTQDARCYECGTLTTVAASGLLEALQLLNTVTVRELSERIEILTTDLVARLREHGCMVRRAEGPDEWSGILSFDVPGHDAQVIARTLEEAHVIVSPRGGRLRAAVHGWNNVQDSMRLLEELPRLAH